MGSDSDEIKKEKPKRFEKLLRPKPPKFKIRHVNPTRISGSLVRWLENGLTAGCGRCCFQCGQGSERWPRVFAVVFGMIIPLFSILLVAWVGGYFLAIFEGDGEIDRNDSQLAAREQVRVLTSLFGNLTTSLPRICFMLFLQNRTMDEFFDQINVIRNSTSSLPVRLEEFTYLNDAYGLGENFNESSWTDQEANGVVLVNLTELDESMSECGDQVAPVVEDMFLILGQSIYDAYSDLTFHWNRCPAPVGNVSSGNVLEGVRTNFILSRASEQNQFYINSWYQDQQELYQVYLSEIPPGLNKTSYLRAQYAAWSRSIFEATGGTECFKNVPASAWYWFVVMATIGYGNQSPVTTWGQVMTYTFGFGSILYFAAVAATSGHILTTIVDDAVYRLGCGYLWSYRWVAPLVWGFLYYCWMIWIALWYIHFKKQRLGVDATMKEAYWFSYISSTSIGFGDLYLEPEVMLAQDLISFPLLFLVGFVLFAAFLEELSELVLHGLRSRGISFTQQLLRQEAKKDAAMQGNPEDFNAKKPEKQQNDEAEEQDQDMQAGETEASTMENGVNGEKMESVDPTSLIGLEEENILYFESIERAFDGGYVYKDGDYVYQEEDEN